MAKKTTKKDKVPTDRLTKEQYQELEITFLKRDNLKQKLQTLALTVESHEQAKQMAVLQRDDTKAKLKRLEIEHKDYVAMLLKKHKIDIKGKAIDPITYMIIEP